MKAVLRSLTGLGYATAWLALGLATVLIAIPLPGVQRRRRVSRAGARALFRLPGLRLTVQGLRALPSGPCVVVANHASYLDGVVLQAALPPRFAFVIKKEMVRVPLVGLLLRRLGSEFVDRFNPREVARDARRVLRLAGSGQALGFFPEGTFTERAGLGRFHSGAFVAAAHAGAPVVPVVIRGTRAVLPPEALLPRPGHICVEILDALAVEGAEKRGTATRLRHAARVAILARLGEPDLDPNATQIFATRRRRVRVPPS